MGKRFFLAQDTVFFHCFYPILTDCEALVPESGRINVNPLYSSILGVLLILNWLIFPYTPGRGTKYLFLRYRPMALPKDDTCRFLTQTLGRPTRTNVAHVPKSGNLHNAFQVVFLPVLQEPFFVRSVPPSLQSQPSAGKSLTLG